MNFQRISEGGGGGGGVVISDPKNLIAFLFTILMFILAKMKYVKNANIYLGNLQYNFPKEGRGGEGVKGCS